MLRSLYSGISGLRSHQTMLDVTGNNIANVNTAGFKSSSVQFEDTLSQLTKGAGAPTGNSGGTNPAQVGLGVQVAGIVTNFNQGSAQATGKATDLMISGDGFFTVNVGGQQLYTRAGDFNLDANGQLVTPDGAVLQGWTAVNGVVQTGGPVGSLSVSSTAVSPARATTRATVSGNVPADAAAGAVLDRQINIYDGSGNATGLDLTFTRTATGWDVAGKDGASTSLTFTNGALTGGGSLTTGGVNVDLSKVTGFTGMTSVSIDSQDGRAAGTLESFSVAKDGTIMGSFSNGAKQAVAQLAMAKFTNPGGLEKAGDSEYRVSADSGAPVLGTAGAAGFGEINAGSLEMSNVDLSQEFTNLIVAQRGFQANARIITTSDQVLQELVDLKR
ncbi:flagellar basal-body rod protein FlgF [Paenarthrobacter sp. DKR-5]|uniref:flagellar basal-body rod protein FlgF n=1 Tax=Paenarthrobacter sp. DKR-5 TaxID=2835535 RepID=UPI001BDC8C40|nr:flagellar basal-body rod protein FlgF [Paenarthrobacter sp. DKR-5]MBT1002805.1 flagellar basal-body rod protein FlgF [Paenarthrobacter sp. DKR-5]